MSQMQKLMENGDEKKPFSVCIDTSSFIPQAQQEEMSQKKQSPLHPWPNMSNGKVELLAWWNRHTGLDNSWRVKED